MPAAARQTQRLQQYEEARALIPAALEPHLRELYLQSQVAAFVSLLFDLSSRPQAPQAVVLA